MNATKVDKVEAWKKIKDLRAQWNGAGVDEVHETEV